MIDELLKYLRETITSHRPYVPTAITEALTEAADTIEILSEKLEANNGWIPCSERLPEESLNSVIGWDEYRRRCCFVQYLGGRWILGNDVDSVKIVAWQPLPEAYHE